MKSPVSVCRRERGVSLVETLMGTAIAMLILGALMIGTIALQRAFKASDILASAQADLIRVSDYMARDVRNSITASAGTSPVLTVTMGDYYNRNGTPSNPADDFPNSPVMGTSGAAYGASVVTVRYYLTGQRVRRELTNSDGVTSAWIGENVNTLTASIGPDKVVTISSTATMGYRIPKPGAPANTLALVMAARPRNP